MSEWIIHLIDQTGYLGVGFLMFLETVFPPIPSEVIMPVAGLAAARGKMGIAGVIAILRTSPPTARRMAK